MCTDDVDNVLKRFFVAPVMLTNSSANEKEEKKVATN